MPDKEELGKCPFCGETERQYLFDEIKNTSINWQIVHELTFYCKYCKKEYIQYRRPVND
jgi:hypothetical protein